MKEHEKPKKPISLAKAVKRAKFLVDVRCEPEYSMPLLVLGNVSGEHESAVEALRMLIAHAEAKI